METWKTTATKSNEIKLKKLNPRITKSVKIKLENLSFAVESDSMQFIYLKSQQLIMLKNTFENLKKYTSRVCKNHTQFFFEKLHQLSNKYEHEYKKHFSRVMIKFDNFKTPATVSDDLIFL